MQVNTFQVFFATNGSSTVVAYLYADDQIQWGNSTVTKDYFITAIEVCSESWMHPDSSTHRLTNDVVRGSNVNVPGLWMFLIINGELIRPG